MTREHILAEIRRTAAVNAGVPLGLERFLAETGIKRSDWFGKYWSQWGDALREAGYAPNSLQGAFSDEFLLQRLAALMRELGHFPTQGELRLKRRSDSAFPNAKTYDRFGTKAEFVERVRDYCRAQPGNADLEAMCPVPPASDAVDETANDSASYGFVYLLRAGRHYKIGKTNSAGRRERELAIQLPERTQTVHVIRTDDPAGIEAYWHNRFSAKRRNGEWFELEPEDIRAFRRRKFM